jgi:hypothetical protein
VRFDITETEALRRRLQGVTEGAAKRALLGAAERVVQHITTDVIPSEPVPPVDRGAYRAGWRARKIPGGAEIVNTLPYAAIIEYGARAGNIKVGWKMITALTGWVKRKGIARDKRPEAVAWAIAQSMRKKGIYNGGKGLRILGKALKKLRGFLAEEIKRELKKGTGG